LKDELAGGQKRQSPYRRIAEECFRLRMEQERLKHTLAVTESNLRITEGKAEAFKLMVHQLEAKHEGYREGVADTFDELLTRGCGLTGMTGGLRPSSSGSTPDGRASR